MRCPRCQHDEDRVLETRVSGEGASIRRRRQCLDCGHRFTTYEYVESASIEVVKRDGRREPFQRQKIEHGLVRACEKRPIAREVIEEVVDRAERDLFRSGKSEIQSVEIGRRVMEALQSLDPVAYVRFASVYLNFQDISQFVETIQNLAQAPPRSESTARRDSASPNPGSTDKGDSTSNPQSTRDSSASTKPQSTEDSTISPESAAKPDPEANSK